MTAIDFRRHALSFRAVGSGPPVVALHGSAATARQWAQLCDHLGDDFRVIAPDMPGYGASAAWPAGGASEQTGVSTAARVSALLQACGRPAHIVGHSAGAVVALDIALARPELVASLTLIEPVAFHLLAGSDAADQALYRDIACLAGVMAAALADGNPQSGMARFVDFWNGYGAFARIPAGRRANLAAQAGQIVNDFAAAFGRTWPVSALTSLAAPVRLIMGLHSPPVAMRVTELLAESIDGAALTIVPDAGHMAPVTHPHVVNRIIEQHIRQAEASAKRAQRFAADQPRVAA